MRLNSQCFVEILVVTGHLSIQTRPFRLEEAGLEEVQCARKAEASGVLCSHEVVCLLSSPSADTIANVDTFSSEYNLALFLVDVAG